MKNFAVTTNSLTWRLIVNRFFNKITIEKSCWEWTAGKDSFGYGRILFNGKNTHAHRVSWVIHNGNIEKGMCVLHKCDNPGCVNPQHLFLGDRTDNHRDMMTKGRFAKNKCEKNGRSKLTKDLAKKIRQEYRDTNIFQWQLGKKYGVSQPVISKVVRNERWVF
jgi:hypothetical protein